MPQLQFSSTVEAPADEAFAWHDRLGALQRLLPPWEPISAISLMPKLATPLTPGNRVKLTLPLLGGLGPHWIAEHTQYDPPREFREVMAEGPLRSWEHTHRFEEVPGGTRVTDELEFELPFGGLGQLMEKAVSHRLRRMFAYRHRQLAEDMAAHAAAAAHGVGRLRIAITGSSGLIGSALSAFLTTGGHAVTHLVRREAGPGEISWDPASGQLNPDDLAGFDVMIHLAGASIGGRWTAGRRRAVVASRVDGTRLIASALATLAGDNAGPGTLICGSAIGLYGPDRGAQALTESSGRGTGFLADLVSEWERATERAEAAGIRVVHARTGVVQSPSGGALGAQLPLFRLGLGGTLSRGNQWLSWIGLDDTVGLLHHAMTRVEVAGALNVASPNPVTNREYTQALGRVLRRPALLAAPRQGLALVLGRQAAEEMLLASQRVSPTAALATGYHFRHPTLKAALRHMLGRTLAPFG